MLRLRRPRLKIPYNAFFRVNKCIGGGGVAYYQNRFTYLYVRNTPYYSHTVNFCKTNFSVFQKLAVSRSLLRCVPLGGANPPPGSRSDCFSLAEVKHVCIHTSYNSLTQREKFIKHDITHLIAVARARVFNCRMGHAQ
ncbi:unnamed protein product [Arctogadus glacialis]